MESGVAISSFSPTTHLYYVLYNISGHQYQQEIRHFDSTSWFTTDLPHIKGESNCIAGALPCTHLSAKTPPVLDLPTTTADSAWAKSCTEAAQSSSFQRPQVSVIRNGGTMSCNTTIGLLRSIINPAYRHFVSDTLRDRQCSAT